VEPSGESSRKKIEKSKITQVSMRVETPRRNLNREKSIELIFLYRREKEPARLSKPPSGKKEL